MSPVASARTARTGSSNSKPTGGGAELGGGAVAQAARAARPTMSQRRRVTILSMTHRSRAREKGADKDFLRSPASIRTALRRARGLRRGRGHERSTGSAEPTCARQADRPGSTASGSVWRPSPSPRGCRRRGSVVARPTSTFSGPPRGTGTGPMTRRSWPSSRRRSICMGTGRSPIRRPSCCSSIPFALAAAETGLSAVGGPDLGVVHVLRRLADHPPDPGRRRCCWWSRQGVLRRRSLARTSLLVGAAMIGGFLWLDRRPALAGVLFAVAACIKPQMMILAPLVLWGRWRTLGWMLGAGAAMVVASLGFGLGRWLEWPHALSAFGRPARCPPIG